MVPESLKPVLETALDAVVAMRPDGRVQAWNRVATETFGWTPDEAVGRNMAELIIPAALREGHREGLGRFLATGVKRILDRRIEIEAIDKAGRAFPVELSVTCVEEAGEKRFIGFLRDISDRRHAQEQLERQARESQLLFDVTRFAAETHSFDETLSATLGAICDLTGWPVGHAFLVGEGAVPTLVASAVWHEREPGMAAGLRSATESIRFGPGVGLPGTIFQTGEAAWFSDAENHENFPRRGHGFGAAFGFPVTSEGRITAILEFFSREQAEPDEALMLIARTLGDQVGRVLERKRTEDHERLMARELNHRVRNTLAIVQSVASQTFRGDAAKELARRAFEDRLSAIAAAHEVLSGRNWERASLSEIVARTLEGCGGGSGRVTARGGKILLPPRIAVSLTMALHELCTNAIKHGALSGPEGKVEIAWSLVGGAEGPMLRLDWTETGGPPVTRPARRGFGSLMIERVVGRELGGTARLRFDPEGVRWSVEAPMPADAPA